MRFFRRKKAEPKRDGRSLETAFKLPAQGSGSAVPLEYAVLEKLFGNKGSDWRVHDRTGSGQHIEKFILETRQGRREVFFDITEVLGTKDTVGVQDVLNGIMRRQAARPLTIRLPKGPFLILYKTLDDLGPQLSTPDFDTAAMLRVVIEAAGRQNASEDFVITLSVAEWIHILSITNVLEVTLLQEELMNDLRAYINGALKLAGPG